MLITGRCNLRCKHCSVTSHGDLKTDLPLSEWVKILDELKRSKLLSLTITGGEPMCRPDFVDFLGEIYARPFRFSINTNATLITPAIIETIKLYSSRFDGFMVSLDGPDRQTVDSQRGDGVFDDMVIGVKKLRMSRIPFGFYCTVTNLNVDRVVETAELAISLGAGWIKFNNYLVAGPVLDSGLIPESNRINRAAEDLRLLTAKYPGKIRGTLLDMHMRMLKFKRGELKKRKDKAFSCGAGLGKVAVFPDGRVTPCDHLPTLTLGDLTNQSLEAILTGDEMHELTRFMNQKRSDNPECKNCKYLEFCTGGCPVEALSNEQAIGLDRNSCLKRALGES